MKTYGVIKIFQFIRLISIWNASQPLISLKFDHCNFVNNLKNDVTICD